MELDVLTEQVRAHPFLAFGVALGAGYLLGSMGSSSASEHEIRGGGRPHHEQQQNTFSRDGRSANGGASRREERGGEDSLRVALTQAVVSGLSALLAREVRSRVAGQR